jgi:hypothetical protein
MTHEELLAKIDSFSCCSGAQELALRAVVELHSPVFEDAYDWCRACETIAYPCLTIQVIEKVLDDN